MSENVNADQSPEQPEAVQPGAQQPEAVQQGEAQPEAAQQEAPRAPLPGEPGFKAPLTKGQLKRMNQTVKGMIISVLLTVAVILPVMFLNPGHTKESYQSRIDAQQIAQQTVTTQGFKAVAPDFPKGYYANKAEWNPGTADGVAYWELGIIGRMGGEDHYVKMLQAQKANQSWIALATDGSVATGKSVTIGSTTWQAREQPGTDKAKAVLTATIDGYTYVLTADHGDDAFLKKAAALIQDAAAKAKPAV